MINEHQKRIIRQTVDEVLNEMLDRRYLCENEEDEGRLSNLLGAAGIAASTMFGSGHANATNPTIHNGNRNIEKPSNNSFLMFVYHCLYYFFYLFNFIILL